MNDLVYRGASELAAAIKGRELSSVEVVDAFLGQIAAKNPALNAIVTLDEEGARARAREADEALARGEVWGPLHGVPVTIKDVLETAGLRTTAGHKPLARHLPVRDAVVVGRLRAAGAIILGKSNTPPLAGDTQCGNPIFGVTNNPWDLSRTPGGSSGGEAAALAAGMTPLGLGSDVGGSVRIPAAYCGLFALKPTEGRVPLAGHIPPLPGSGHTIEHLATCGPMARSVADLRLALDVIADERGPAPQARSVEGLRIAWAPELGGLPVAADSRAALEALAGKLAAAGARVEIATPTIDVEQLWQTYGELFGAILFPTLPMLARLIVRMFGRLMAKDVISRSGFRVALAGKDRYDAIVAKRDQLSRALEDFVAGYDAWLLPATVGPAPPHRAMGKIHTPIDVGRPVHRRQPGGHGLHLPRQLDRPSGRGAAPGRRAPARGAARRAPGPGRGLAGCGRGGG